MESIVTALSLATGMALSLALAILLEETIFVRLLGPFFRRRLIRAETGSRARRTDRALPRVISAAKVRNR
jgi:hypothetical protein